MVKIWKYFGNRIREKGTWIAIGAGVPTAAALSYPWNIVAIVLTVLGVFAPTP